MKGWREGRGGRKGQGPLGGERKMGGGDGGGQMRKGMWTDVKFKCEGEWRVAVFNWPR